MASNLELKVRCSAVDHVRARECASEAGGSDPIELKQRDTYFVVPNGRLKLRKTDSAGAKSAELIQYSRPDLEGMRLSTYQRIEIAAETADEFEEALARSLGVLTVVEKVRCLLILGTTRIHLDSVSDLGTFIELETVLGSSEINLDRGQAEYDHVVASLGLGALDPVPGSYSDLLLGRESSE